MSGAESESDDTPARLPAGCVEMAQQNARSPQDARDILDKLGNMGDMLTPEIVKLSVERHYLQIDLAMKTLKFNDYVAATTTAGRPLKPVALRRLKLETEMNDARTALDACVDGVLVHQHQQGVVSRSEHELNQAAAAHSSDHVRSIPGNKWQAARSVPAVFDRDVKEVDFAFDEEVDSEEDGDGDDSPQANGASTAAARAAPPGNAASSAAAAGVAPPGNAASSTATARVVPPGNATSSAATATARVAPPGNAASSAAAAAARVARRSPSHKQYKLTKFDWSRIKADWKAVGDGDKSLYFDLKPGAMIAAQSHLDAKGQKLKDRFTSPPRIVIWRPGMQFRHLRVRKEPPCVHCKWDSTVVYCQMARPRSFTAETRGLSGLVCGEKNRCLKCVEIRKRQTEQGMPKAQRRTTT